MKLRLNLPVLAFLIVLPLLSFSVFGQNQETLLVWDFEAKNGVKEQDTFPLMVIIYDQVSKYERYNIIKQRYLANEILVNSKECKQGKCAVAIGQDLGAHKLLIGSFSKLGGKYQISGSIVNLTNSADYSNALVSSDQLDQKLAENFVMSLFSKLLEKECISGGKKWDGKICKEINIVINKLDNSKSKEEKPIEPKSEPTVENQIKWEGDNEYKPEYTPGFFNKFGFGLWSKNTSFNRDSNPKVLQLNLLYGETKDLYGLNVGLGVTWFLRGEYKDKVRKERVPRIKGISLNVFSNGLPGDSYFDPSLGSQDITGASVSGFINISNNVSGLSAGFINLSYGDKKGVSISGVSYGDSLSGISIGIFNGAKKELSGIVLGIVSGGEKVKGISIGGLNGAKKELIGTQLGVVNSSGETKGVQVGIYNDSDSTKGAQIGLINYSSGKSWLQIGLINYSKRNWLPFFPFINFDFSDE